MPKKIGIELDSETKQYLALKKSKSTFRAYSAGFQNFLDYYHGKYGKDVGMSHFLDRIFEEMKKDQRDRQRLAETEISGFVDYLKDHKFSNNSIRLYFAALQNFLKYKGIAISMGFIDMPSPTEKVNDDGSETNGKHEWGKEEIKKFVDAATNYRDKAIILCLYQSGLGVHEICKLNYAHIKEEFEAGILPICLKLVRQKTSVKFKTFFGRDAVHYLRLYLATRGELKPSDPLFIKERLRGEDVRMNDNAIEGVFLEIARRVDFIHFNGGYNPARPHSLRSAFNSRLINKIDKDLREFWMGHAIGTVAKAYLTMPTDDLRELYMTAETYLKIEKTSREELDEKLRGKSIISDVLESDVKALKAKVESLETMYNKLFEVSPEELRELMQEISRRKFAQQKEEDKKVKVQ
jgi:integrase